MYIYLMLVALFSSVILEKIVEQFQKLKHKSVAIFSEEHCYKIT